jgi:hypothetical protein
MDLVRSLRRGSFDKQTPSDTAAIEPDVWFEHFRQLLGTVRPLTLEEERMKEYIDRHSDTIRSDQQSPIEKEELVSCVRALTNSKATYFDYVYNNI